jgi:phenylalanyl-tRNA synthetase beta chain
VGATLPGLRIERRSLRGVDSEGMLVSRAELGLEEGSDGIWVLPAGTPLGADVLSATRTGATLTLSITPNRPDLLSHLGVAREIAAAMGARLKPANWRLTEKGADVAASARVVVDDPAGCRRYLARVVKNVKVGPSPAWLAARLLAVGYRPINNVVDVTNYVLAELGHPLHAFDLSRLAVERNLPTVRVRAAKPGERLVTLDGVDRALHAEDLVIADAERAVALAGVMGGQGSEVAPETTAILIESAYFDPVRIRRGARRHGLHTEASHRFERGADPNILGRAVDRCAQLCAELCEGEVAKGTLEVAVKPEPPLEISLRLARIPRLLGVTLSAEVVVQLLDPLEVRCVARNEGALRFQPPSFRPDLCREIDLIEELARRHGYERIPERLPDTSADYAYEPLPDSRLEALRATLCAAGLSEAVTWGFGHPDQQRQWAEPGTEPLRLQNPIGEELAALRTSMIPALLGALGRNLRHGARAVRLYEIGPTFHPRAPDPAEDPRDRGLPREDRRLALVLWGERHAGRWYQGSERIDFSDASGVIENAIAALELAAPIEREPAELANLHPQAGAILRAGSTRVGIVGALHPTLAAALEAPAPVLVAELSLTALLALPRRRTTFVSLPRFPGTRRDVAVVVDEALPAETLRAFLAAHAGGALGREVVDRVFLFDVFRGKAVSKGKKSLAFAIEYLDRGRTLTDAEVNAAFAAVLARLKESFAVEIRE